MKIDDLHHADFREMRLQGKVDFWGAANLLQFFSQGFGYANFMADKSYIGHLRNFIALILEAFKEHDNISPEHSSYSSPTKCRQNFQKPYW